VDPDNIPGEGLRHIVPVLGHENGGVGQGDLFSDPVVNHFHPPFEFAGADPDKRDPVAMGRVHIGLDFKRETWKGFFVGRHFTGDGHARTRRRCHFDKCIQQFFDTEIIDGAAEKYRRLASF